MAPTSICGAFSKRARPKEHDETRARVAPVNAPDARHARRHLSSLNVEGDRAADVEPGQPAHALFD